MNLNRSTLDLWVGVFVALGIGAILFLALKVGNLIDFASAPGYQFTKDTIASILTSGLLGDVYIGLDPGGDPQMLADGGTVSKTQSGIVLEKLIGQFLFDKAAQGGAPK